MPQSWNSPAAHIDPSPSRRRANDGGIRGVLGDGGSGDVEDVLRVGSAPRQDRGGENRADEGQATNGHCGRYDHSRHRAAEAGLATRQAVVVRTAGGARLTLHETCDEGRLGQEKPEDKDHEEAFSHQVVSEKREYRAHPPRAPTARGPETLNTTLRKTYNPALPPG